MPKQSPQAAVQSTPKPKKKPNKMPDNEATESKLDAKDKEESGNSESNVPQEPTSPRKDASTDPQTDMADMIKKDDLKDILECPVCLRVPRSTPIYQVCWIWDILINIEDIHFSVCPGPHRVFRVSPKRDHVSAVPRPPGKHPVPHFREDVGEASLCL